MKVWLKSDNTRTRKSLSHNSLPLFLNWNQCPPEKERGVSTIQLQHSASFEPKRSKSKSTTPDLENDSLRYSTCCSVGVMYMTAIHSVSKSDSLQHRGWVVNIPEVRQGLAAVTRVRKIVQSTVPPITGRRVHS